MDPDGRRVETLKSTAPNLEVRVGAILTLERIARDNPGDHIRVMDILCAYIRETVPPAMPAATTWASGPSAPEPQAQTATQQRAKLLSERPNALELWISALPMPRAPMSKWPSK